MDKKLFFMLLLLLGAVACSKNPRTNVLHSLSELQTNESDIRICTDSIIDLATDRQEKCKTIRIPRKDRESCLDTIVSSYTFVPLQTKENCVVGQIEKIIVCPNCFCILDRDNRNAFLFELDGTFRCKLGEKGHGPGEHLDAWNIAYDNEKQEIILLDLEGRKLMHYDLDGKLQHVESIYYLFTALEYQKDNMILYTGTSYNDFSDILDLSQLVIADRKQVPRAAGFRTPEQARNEFSFSSRMQKVGDEVIYDDMLSDTLWSITGKRKYPLVAISFDKSSRFNKEDKQHISDRLFHDRENRFGSINNWRISSNYISLLVRTPDSGRRLFNVLYSRKSGKCRVFGNNIGQKRLGDYLMSAAFDGVYDSSSFIRIVEPMDIMRYKENKRLNIELDQKEQDMLESLTLEDNPVLMIARLTDF